MIAWLGSVVVGLSLRTKALALAAFGIAAAIGYLWLRWKLATRKATTQQERADKLEATRVLEQRIAAGQASLKARQAKVREQILSRKERDHFE